MKTRHLLLAGILGILAASTAGAQTVIYISGAPAARQPFSTAINRLLTSSTTAGLVTVAYSGTNTTTLTTANALTWYGGNINGTPVTVKVSYVGSSAGIQDVAAQLTAKFLPIGATAAGSPYAEPNTAGNANDPEIPNFTASDEFQASTPWQGTNSLTGTSVAYQQLFGDDIVGVLPYRWVSNVDAPSRLSNITPHQAQLLFKTGWIYLSQLTGSNADENLAAYAIGRDIGSGLRTVLLSETAIGVQTGVQQYEPTVSTTNSLTYVASQVLYPAETVNGVSLGTGDGGYSSFSGLQAALEAYTNSNGGNLSNTANVDLPGYYVTGLADSDAQTVFAKGAHEVAWNGFYLGTLGTYGNGAGQTGSASFSLSEGQYTFWSYLQLQYQTSKLSNSVNATAYAFEQALVNDLRHTDSPVLLKDMNVYRTQDGELVLGGNPYGSL
ncbi:MAG: hypothetical protein ABSE62_00700 [Chthoniobacteraceae bacterium]|jgi:hypothetical protein